MNSKRIEYLKFSIQLLMFLNLWPRKIRSLKNTIKDSLLIVLISITTFPVLANFLVQFQGNDVSVSELIEALVGVMPLYGVIYVVVCFKLKSLQILHLIKDLEDLESFSSEDQVLRAENSATFYAKIFLIYGIVGNVFYTIMPLLTYESCIKSRTPHMLRNNIPCGLVGSYILPFRYDVQPFFQIILIEQIAVCIVSTLILMTMTMFLSGVLIHTTSHLKNLQDAILNLSNLSGSDCEAGLRKCVEYHASLIHYSEKINKSFGSMMLFHITGTNLIMSLICFVIITKPNYFDSIRFILHLVGWLAMLSIVCHYGQTLMDESFSISAAIYEITWYKKNSKICKDLVIVLRESQKILTLKAGKLRPMCLSTFLNVLYSAYSYFTLLLKFKSNFN